MSLKMSSGLRLMHYIVITAYRLLLSSRLLYHFIAFFVTTPAVANMSLTY